MVTAFSVQSAGDLLHDTQTNMEALKYLDWFEVLETRGHLVDGKIAHWQVTIKVGMRLESLASEKPAGKKKGK